MVEAARNRRLEVVRWLCEQFGGDPSINLLAELEDDSDDSWLCREYKADPNTAMDIAAMYGHLDVLQFLHSIDLELRKDRDRHHSIQERCTSRAMDAAAAFGHLEIVKWLHFNRTEGCTTEAMSDAAFSRHFDIVKWLYYNRSEGFEENIMDIVARQQFHRPECFIQYGCRCVEKAPPSFEDDQISMLEWLRINRSESCSPISAAYSGHLKILEWLYTNTTALSSPSVMDKAARCGQLDIVKWIHENRSEGCTAAAMDKAAENGHVEMVKWLYSNRSEGCLETPLASATNAWSKITARQQFAVVKFLLSKGLRGSASSAMLKSFSDAVHFEVILLLHEHKPIFNDDEVRQAKERLHQYSRTEGRNEIIAWFEENYPCQTRPGGETWG